MNQSQETDSDLSITALKLILAILEESTQGRLPKLEYHRYQAVQRLREYLLARRETLLNRKTVEIELPDPEPIELTEGMVAKEPLDEGDHEIVNATMQFTKK